MTISKIRRKISNFFQITKNVITQSKNSKCLRTKRLSISSYTNIKNKHRRQIIAHFRNFCKPQVSIYGKNCCKNHLTNRCDKLFNRAAKQPTLKCLSVFVSTWWQTQKKESFKRVLQLKKKMITNHCLLLTIDINVNLSC